jgi:hypothetical protein
MSLVCSLVTLEKDLAIAHRWIHKRAKTIFSKLGLLPGIFGEENQMWRNLKWLITINSFGYSAAWVLENSHRKKQSRLAAARS